jgi:CubicO group peptidase (beta-lactamase class C family)
MVNLAAPLGEAAPELVHPRWAPISAWHVLTHTTGIDDIDLEQVLRHGGDRADLLRHVSQQGQQRAPGTTFRYASFTFDLLAEALARALDEPFEAMLRRTLLAPLGMTATSFDPASDPDLAPRMAPVAVGRWDGPPTTEDEALIGAFTRLRLKGGGIWSTAGDLLRFARALLRGGELDGARVLSPTFVELMTREVTVPRAVTWGGLGGAEDPLTASHYALGWGKPGILSPASPGAYGHGGVSGTRLWIDPELDMAYVYLTGRWGLPLAPIDAVEGAIYAGLSSLDADA